MPATRGSASEPVPQQDNALLQAIVVAITALSSDVKAALVQMLTIWLGLPPLRKALLLKVLMPRLPDRIIAAAAGIHRTTLFEWPEYKRLKRILARRRRLPEGAADADREVLEAWFEME